MTERFDPIRAAAEQHREIVDWMHTVDDPTLPRMPWVDLDRVVGPLPPGFLVAVGGRAKAGKTSFMLGWANGAAERDHAFVFGTTEIRAAHCKYAWAAARLGLWRGTNGVKWSGEERQRVLDEVARLRIHQSKQIVFRDMAKAVPQEFLQAVRQAGDDGARYFFYDYFQRLQTRGRSRWDALAEAIQDAKEVAKEAGVVLVMAAQLHPGKDRDQAAKYMPPSDADWWGGPGPQQEADICLQLWRPLKIGLERGALEKFRRGELPASAIAADGVMGVRCSGHRYSGWSNDQIRQLAIHEGRITDLYRTTDDVEARYGL